MYINMHNVDVHVEWCPCTCRCTYTWTCRCRCTCTAKVFVSIWLRVFFTISIHMLLYEHSHCLQFGFVVVVKVHSLSEIATSWSDDNNRSTTVYTWLYIYLVVRPVGCMLTYVPIIWKFWYYFWSHWKLQNRFVPNIKKKHKHTLCHSNDLRSLNTFSL